MNNEVYATSLYILLFMAMHQHRHCNTGPNPLRNRTGTYLTFFSPTILVYMFECVAFSCFYSPGVFLIQSAHQIR